MLDEIIIGGYLQESSKKHILKSVSDQEALVEDKNEEEEKTAKK